MRRIKIIDRNYKKRILRLNLENTKKRLKTKAYQMQLVEIARSKKTHVIFGSPYLLLSRGEFLTLLTEINRGEK